MKANKHVPVVPSADVEVIATPPKENTLETTLGKVLKFLLPGVLTVAGAIGGVIASVVTPYADSIKQHFFHESAVIHVDSPTGDIRVADAFDVNVFVSPNSPLPLSPGEISVTYSKQIIHPTVESEKLLHVQTPDIKYSRKVFDSPLEFVADVPGDAIVTVTMTTADPSSRMTPFTASLTKHVDKTIDNSHPRWDNIHNCWIFNGKWSISVGGQQGQIEMVDVGQVLSGKYRLANGVSGPIAGQHDGDTFHITLYIGQEPQRYYLYGGFMPGKNSNLNLKGKAEFQAPSIHKGQFEAKQVLEFDGVPLTS